MGGTLCGKSCCQKIDHKYEGYTHCPPPEPTNACDETYLFSVGTPATLAMGCFWGAQASIDSIPGVLRSRVGISGGASIKNANREERLAGPCEVVDFEFDEDQVTYSHIVDIFFGMHDPYKPCAEELYQSVIFYHTEEQREAAEEAIKILRGERSQSNLTTGVVQTKVVPAERVIVAKPEDQHYELQRQDENVLKAIGFFGMNAEQRAYSHLLCRLNGYLAVQTDMLQQFEEEKYELKLKEAQEIIVRNMLSKTGSSESQASEHQPSQHSQL